MAKVSFDNLSLDTSNNNDTNYQVSFFNLGNGEEAIVRIMIDSTNDFDIHTVHNVEMQGFQYGRRMNCLRTPSDPIEMCPLCAAGKQLQQKIFIKLIQYEVTANGQVIPHAKVWERSVNDRNFGARALKGYIDNYGPLSDMVCKIIRRGEKLNTEYQFIPNLGPSVYRPDIYVKDSTIFGDYTPLGSAILDKTYSEYQQFLTTGTFPATVVNNNATTAPTSAPQVTTTPQVTPRTYTPAATPNYGTPIEGASSIPMTPPMTTAVPPTSPKPWEVGNTTPAAAPGFERPRRY